MSLKAKIEAVIYASEEPVTLPQLVGLLGQEAQAELDALDERQSSLPLVAQPEMADAAQAVAETNPSAEEKDAALLTELPVTEAEANPDPAIGTAAEKRAAREAERRVREHLAGIVAQLVKDYAEGDRGLELREIAGGLRMATKPEYHDAVRGFVRSLKPPLKLSLQALETLAVVSYKQPVTAPEVSEIRGVDSGGVLGSLIARKLVTTAGRKQVVGRPILYKTTKDFLLRFGLKDISELPSIEEFEKMAGEFASQQPNQEEMTMPEENDTVVHRNLEEEKTAVEPQADGDSDSLNADESNRPNDALPAVDGRMSIAPPSYDGPDDNPSADEAAIQSEGEGA